MSSRDTVQSLLAQADIQLNGSRPWDITVHNEALYDRVLTQGSLGFGEAYMDGWWDCAEIDRMLTKVFESNLESKIRTFGNAIAALKARVFNQGRISKAFEIGEKHYDIGNDLYERMLDKRMVYTCGYWSAFAKASSDGEITLDEAQEAKLDLVCRKIGLTPGMRVLDIGCGWGSFCKFAAEKYGVSMVGVTVSGAQAELARERCAGLPVEIILEDYRDIKGEFDRVVSLGMFEHVGYKNYETYMKVAHRVLKDGGLFLLHTIGGNHSEHTTDAWIDKYIFPNSMLPSIAQIGKAAEPYFVMEDWHNFSAYYDKTLQVWYANVEKAWPELASRYGERFHRMWRFYLLSSAATFRARKSQLWQIVLSKGGVKGGYASIR